MIVIDVDEYTFDSLVETTRERISGNISTVLLLLHREIYILSASFLYARQNSIEFSEITMDEHDLSLADRLLADNSADLVIKSLDRYYAIFFFFS